MFILLIKKLQRLLFVNSDIYTNLNFQDAKASQNQKMMLL